MIKLLPLLLLLTSCNLLTDTYFYTKARNQELYFHPDFYGTQNIPRYLWENIRYKPDSDGDSWSSPKNTFMRAYGDCEDVSLLYLNILYVSTGKKGSLVLVEVPGRGVVHGGDINHAIVEVDGVLIDPQTGMVGNYKIAYRYSFYDIFGL